MVGELAGRLGAKVPHRLVASAKSWICHGGINRRAPVLPWNAPEGEPQISPYGASVQYLVHLKAIWDAEQPSAPLKEQDVTITVPASFDEAARELTLDAAKEAGYGKGVRLIEEPQAAFYDISALRATRFMSSWRSQAGLGGGCWWRYHRLRC